VPADENGYRHTPIRLRMTGDERRNIIPVEWVSAVMCRLFETPEARGLTFHIAPDKPISSREMIEYCGEYFKSTGVEFHGHGELPPLANRAENEDQWMFERMVMENAETYAPYEQTDNVFDMTNTKKFAGDIPCPEIDKTVIFR
jgi:nucleoside-diphosphate-sugar epimerase